jgi:hypothetical protein
MRSRWFVLMLVGLFGFLFVSPVLAQDELETAVDETPLDTSRLAWVRFVHLAPDAPSYDILLNGEMSGIQTLNYGDITGWVEVYGGRYNLALQPLLDDAEALMLQRPNFALPFGSWTTINLVGSQAEGTLNLQAVEEDYRDTPADSRLTLLHALESAPSVDILLPDGETLVASLGFGEVATVDLPAGTYDLRVVPSGDTLEGGFLLPAIDLSSNNKTYVAVRADMPGQSNPVLTLLTLNPEMVRNSVNLN